MIFLENNSPEKNVSLSSKDHKDLVRLENEIESDLPAFLRVGRLLAEINQRRLYKLTHKSWDHYCRDRWGWTGNYGYKQIAGAKTVDKKCVPAVHTLVPVNERQARAAAKSIEVRPVEKEKFEDAEIDKESSKIPFGKLSPKRQLEVLEKTRERLQKLAILHQQPPEQQRRYNCLLKHLATVLAKLRGLEGFEDELKLASSLDKACRDRAQSIGLTVD